MAETSLSCDATAAAPRWAVISIGGALTIETDQNGKEVQRLLIEAGHAVVERTVVPEEATRFINVLRHWIAADVSGVVVTGGSGLGLGESAVEIARRFFDREIPAFEQIFACLAYQAIGAAALSARAAAGLAGRKVVVVLPEGLWAVRLGMEKLILPEVQRVQRMASILSLGAEGSR